MFWLFIFFLVLFIISLSFAIRCGINDYEGAAVVLSVITLISFLLLTYPTFCCISEIKLAVERPVAEEMYPIVKEQVRELEERYGKLIDKYIMHEQNVYDNLNKENDIYVMAAVPNQNVSESLDQVFQRYIELKDRLIGLQETIVRGKQVRYTLFFL